jgi:hypothetical protein
MSEIMQNLYRSHRPMFLSAVVVSWMFVCSSYGTGLSKARNLQEGTNDTPSGKICVARFPKINPLDSYLGTRARPSSKSVFRVVLDNIDSASITSDSGAAFVKMDTSVSHKLKISLDGTLRENFKFDFKTRGSISLCLFYRKAYGTWSLEPLKWHEKKCSCPD